MALQGPQNITTEGAILGGVIALLRGARNPEMSQQDLAREMGLSPSAWSRVEKGETELTALQLKLVAEVLGSDANSMFDMVDRFSGQLRKSGIGVEQTTIGRLANRNAALAHAGASVAAAVAGSVVPVIGSTLAGILGAYMSAYASTRKPKRK